MTPTCGRDGSTPSYSIDQARFLTGRLPTTDVFRRYPAGNPLSNPEPSSAAVQFHSAMVKHHADANIGQPADYLWQDGSTLPTLAVQPIRKLRRHRLRQLAAGRPQATVTFNPLPEFSSGKYQHLFRAEAWLDFTSIVVPISLAGMALPRPSCSITRQ